MTNYHEKNRRTRFGPSRVLPWLSCLSFACGGDGTGSAGPAPSFWITEAEYRFGDAPERDVLFSRAELRVDTLRNRVLVVDYRNLQVSAWSPRGDLLFKVGRRAINPGEFEFTNAFFVDPGSFSVLRARGSRVIRYSASGELEATAHGPPPTLRFEGFELSLYSVKDGTYLGLPWVMPEIEIGVPGTVSFSRQPLLRVRSAGEGRWHDPEPIFWLDFSNRKLAGRLPDGRWVVLAQPFGDADQVRIEPGSAVVMRLKDGPGAVELIEVNALGDTVWQRRLQFEPLALTGQMIDDYVERHVEGYAPSFHHRASPRELRQMFHDALYKPEYLPAADRLYVTASGDVWLRTLERLDTLRTHYVVRRGESDAEPRRVLLPEWLVVHDATETHVWGVWPNWGGRPQVVGRRLVPVFGSEPRTFTQGAMPPDTPHASPGPRAPPAPSPASPSRSPPRS